MPLHDWTDERRWDDVYLLWQVKLVEWIQPRLPLGFRAYLGGIPTLTFDIPRRPIDVRSRGWRDRMPDPRPFGANELTPDDEVIANFSIDPQRAIHIDWRGQLIAALEITLPANKDRIEAQERFRRRCLGYLRQGVHLLLIDVFPRPQGVSFADAISADLGLSQPPMPSPCAISYRVGGPVATDDSTGTLMSVWRRPLQVGQSLPALPLPFDDEQAVLIDLEESYMLAARMAYLD
jgi:hypothetical protein